MSTGKIDWWGVNARSAKKYEQLLQFLEAVKIALDEAGVAVEKYEVPANAGTWQRIEKEVLKTAVERVFEDLAGLRVKTIENEAKLKAWEWSL